MTTIRPTLAAAILIAFVVLPARSVSAGEPVLPDGYPECRRDIEGTWYSTSWTDDSFASSGKVRFIGNEIWWSNRGQTRRMTPLEARSTRQLFELNRPFDDVYSDGTSRPYFKYVVIENPIGWFGTEFQELIWPCAATFVFCRQGWVAQDVLREQLDTPFSISSEGCIFDNFVPYRPETN